jgi:hypothetical protein
MEREEKINWAVAKIIEIWNLRICTGKNELEKIHLC